MIIKTRKQPSLKKQLTISMIFIFSTMLGQRVYGTQVLTLNEQQRLKIAIAPHELNRIGLTGDRISQVFGAEGQFSLESDEESGQIFIKPLDPTNHQPVNVTLITEGGLTQDLTLIPNAKTPTSVILKNMAVSKSLTHGTSSHSVTHLLSLIRQAVNQQTPDGHMSIRCKVAPRLTLLPVTLTPRHCWQGPQTIIISYQLSYQGQDHMVLQEADLAQEQDQALALETRTLKGGASTTLIVVASQERI